MGGVKVVVEVVVVGPASRPRWNEGNCTGVRNTMMHTTATRQPPASSSNLRLCSMAPRRTARKKPLNRKKRAMLTELCTAHQRTKSAPGCRRRTLLVEHWDVEQLIPAMMEHSNGMI